MILVAIGSNLNSKLFGSPEQNCNAAIDMLRKYFEVTQSSSFYKTEPIPRSEQPWFVNCIVNIKSKISPSRILDTLLEIESQFGRKRNRKKREIYMHYSSSPNLSRNAIRAWFAWNSFTFFYIF